MTASKASRVTTRSPALTSRLRRRPRACTLGEVGDNPHERTTLWTTTWVYFTTLDVVMERFFAEDMGEPTLMDTYEEGNMDTAFNEKVDCLQEKTRRRGLVDNSSALTSCMRLLTRA